MTIQFPARLREFASRFDPRFGEYLEPTSNVPAELVEAVRYTALAPGKRLRPYLVTRCCELSGGRLDDAWPVAAAVECVHAFSLIHDDLPAMDDDDLRRDLPTCHKKFGDATAILAGDTLMVLSFELLARQVRDQSLAARMVLQLAWGSGWGGMIGGQAADIHGEAERPTLERAKYIHERKTASLFAAACRLGAMAGYAEDQILAHLGQFGQRLGQAFQITDDLLDLATDANVVGKKVGKDERANKQTFPRCVGTIDSRKAAREAVEEAIEELECFGPAADDLRVLARYVLDRDY